MKKMQDAILIICIFFLGICMEWVRVEYEIPVTLLDLVLFPISLIFSFFSLKWFVIAKPDDYHLAGITKKKLLVDFAVISLIFIPLGGWSVMAGITGLFEFFHGVRGSVHGYTLATVGILFIILWAFSAVQTTRILASRKTRNDYRRGSS